MRALIALAVCLPIQSGAPEQVGGVAYQKLATRDETLARMETLLAPSPARFGEWHLLSPFPYAGHDKGDLATVLPPEAELEGMRAGGPGPDLGASYRGKKDVAVAWEPLGRIDNRMVDLNVHADVELNDQAICYLYAPVEAEQDCELDLTCGSDDGLRLWLNGELLIDHDVDRGIDPTEEKLHLRLARGTNHLLAKVSEGQGGWAFQINTREPLAPEMDALLYYYLDRDFPPTRERAHYRALTYPVPAGLVLEVGGLAFLGDGRPVVTTRRGDVFLVEDAYAEPPTGASFRLFASGLHEPLGAAVRRDEQGEAIYAAQRGELTRLRDTDGDDRADAYETVCDAWGLSGNYHEFAFGPEFDRDGNAWVTLNVGFSGAIGTAAAPWRGSAVMITPQGEMRSVCDGLRSPNGFAAWVDGEFFYVDNQGDYVATNKLAHLRLGSFHGHPASLRWREGLDAASERPEREPAAVWFPYKKMGQSAADVALDDTGGKFGPFGGQLFVGDQMNAWVMRVCLEKVDGVYQGACFPFATELDSGVNRVAFAPDGSMLIGQTDRGWGSLGRKSYGLQRIVYTGVEPFEILAMRVREDGFELELTRDADRASAADPKSYRLKRYTYDYHADYGAPEKDTSDVAVAGVEVVDARRVRLRLAEMRAGYVHELDAGGLRSAASAGRASEPLLHALAYYTVNRVPGQPGGAGGIRVPGSPDGVASQDDYAATIRNLRPVLFLTHSAGFVHDVVKRQEPDMLAYAEEQLLLAARGRFRVTCTQDCAAITAENLARYQAVVLYTTGELPISEENRAALMDWVRRGGALVGVHCATDTFYEYPPYQELIGGVFDGHPWHEAVTARVDDPSHPAVDHLGASFEITDEIYQFKGFRRHPTRVLLSLDPASVDASKGARADGDYALAWCRDWGEGRVFYTALGHRKEVWKDPRFQQHLLDGIEWAIRGPDWMAKAPSDATALFDGASLAAWTRRRDGGDAGGNAGWNFVDGTMEVAAGAGDLVSRESFGDALIHVEFRIPSMPDAEGQARGNSGVYVQGRYEVQVLDSHGLEPGLGDCGAIYGVRAPSQNACRAPDRWQSYDIEFRAPRFDSAGKKSESARMTVWHNGIPIHQDVEVPGPTGGAAAEKEAPTGPLMLQDHGNPVRYRNVWVQALP